MGKMTKQNLGNIKDRFEQQTGAELRPLRRKSFGGKLLVLAALIALGAILAAFTCPLFTPLNGDELQLNGTYLGDGIVSVQVKNGSDRQLQFTDAKLYSWNDGGVELVPGGAVKLDDVRFEPHSEGVLTVDLSGAYDIEYLETTLPGKPRDSWYYLLLTNNSFLFGHDWMCSFHFVQETEIGQTEALEPVQTECMEEMIPEELRFYFEQAYYDVIPAFNEAHFTYQQRVQELLLRTRGTFVRPVDPMLLVEGPEGVVFDERIPAEEQHRLLGQGYSSLDGYRRMVGSSFSGVTSDFVLQLWGWIPREAGEAEGGVQIPLVYFAVYKRGEVEQDGAYGFLSGQILSFADMEQMRVFTDAQHVVYDVTALFYTDLDGYIDAFVGGNSLSFDETLRQRLHNLYDYCKIPGNLNFYYNLPDA